MQRRKVVLQGEKLEWDMLGNLFSQATGAYVGRKETVGGKIKVRKDLPQVPEPKDEEEEEEELPSESGSVWLSRAKPAPEVAPYVPVSYVEAPQRSTDLFPETIPAKDWEKLGELSEKYLILEIKLGKKDYIVLELGSRASAYDAETGKYVGRYIDSPHRYIDKKARIPTEEDEERDFSDTLRRYAEMEERGELE